MNIKQWYDRVFGNNDGKFTMADLPNKAVLIVGIVVDVLFLFAEYRVWMVGYALTENAMLAVGFVLVSSLPFYLGQIAYLYNRANNYQQALAVGMVGMGLGVSAYYGFSDFLLANSIAVTNTLTVTLDTNSLFAVAVGGTVALILIGLLYILIDDDIANTIKAKRIEGKARTAEHELELKSRLLAKLQQVRLQEDQLKSQFPEDYEALQEQFVAAANKSNPTKGSGNTR
jgi:hypothetical protein